MVKKKPEKKKHGDYLAVFAFAGLAILIIGIIGVFWWLAQSIPPDSVNQTIQPPISNNTSTNITEPPITEPNVTEPNNTEPFFTSTDQPNGVLVETKNSFKFSCPQGWVVGIGHNEKFGNYDSYIFRCAKDDSFVSIYSILDAGQPDVQQMMAAIKNEIRMEGGRDFESVGGTTEYSFSNGSMERHGLALFNSCNGKITISRIETPSSAFGFATMTEIMHSLQCA